MNNSPNNTLIHATIKIDTHYKNGDKGSGTGFFFRFAIGNDKYVDTIITNRHVIENSHKGILAFTHKSVTKDNEPYPKFGMIESVELDDFGTMWVPHPDPHIDLCAFPLHTYIPSVDQYYYVSLHEGNLLKETLSVSAIEEIYMIGYPRGLWDSENNLPIVRKGITATGINFDLNGKREFLIDSACFPGSSGSPIMLYTQTINSIEGGINFKSDRWLVGILYAGPQFKADGTIEIVDVPTKATPVAYTQIPMNLGYAIKSNELLAFKTVFSSMV